MGTKEGTIQAYWIFIIVALMCHVVHMENMEKQTNAEGMDIKEYCENEVFFKPKCEDNKVIVVKHARYGRMHEGRCIPDAKGFIGCSMDAKDLISSKCSGLRSCDVIIATIPPKHNPPCDTGLRGFLEAAYECVEVVHPPRGYCRTGEVTEIRNQRGYLSSLVAEETGCGASLSPWRISVEPGQQLSFQLLVFSEETSQSRQGNKAYCVLKEESSSAGRSLLRESTAFKTMGHRVEVTMMTREANGGIMDTFLIKFEAIGCPTIAPPTNGWTQRVGDEMHMGCNNTVSGGQRNEWTMRCADNKWIGNIQTCAAIQLGERDAHVTVSNDKPVWTFLTESNALIITPAVGMAILIGLCLLVLGMVYICRLKRGARHARQRSVEVSDDGRHNRHCPRVHEPVMEGEEDKDDNYCPTERAYYRSMPMKPQRHGRYVPKQAPSGGNMPLPPPPYTPTRPISVASTNRWSRGGTEHVYARPAFAIPPSDQAAEGDTHSMTNSYNRPEECYGECDHMNTL